MNIATIILVFVVSWWLIFFMALPVGVRSQQEEQDTGELDVTEGTVPSAPVNPNLKKKALWTTLAAVLITTVYYFVATSGLISFREY